MSNEAPHLIWQGTVSGKAQYKLEAWDKPRRLTNYDLLLQEFNAVMNEQAKKRPIYLTVSMMSSDFTGVICLN